MKYLLADFIYTGYSQAKEQNYFEIEICKNNIEDDYEFDTRLIMVHQLYHEDAFRNQN